MGKTRVNSEQQLTALNYVIADGTSWPTSVTITGTSAQATGYSITIPSDGLWFVTGSIRARLDTSSAARYMRISLHKNGGMVGDTRRITNYLADSAQHNIQNEPLSTIVECQAGDVIEYYGELSDTSGVTYGRVESDANGYSSLMAFRIGPPV